MIRIPESRRRKPVDRFYVCDRKKCDDCSGSCRHTSDIDHALYADHPEDTFDAMITKDFGCQKWERIRR